MSVSKYIHTIQAATATATGQAINIECAEKVVFVFKRSNHSAGSTAFTVEVSGDGTTWLAYNKLISNVTNTNAQDLTRVASVSLASNTSSFVTMDKDDGFKFVRVIATETTDGTHDAWVYLEID
jgi:N-acetyl-beta-hexosaminidase